MKQLCLMFVCLFLVVGCNSSATPLPPLLPTNPPVDLPALDSATIQLGQTLYLQNCASCHGEELAGQPDWKTPNEDGSFRSPPHDETGHTWHHSDEILLDSIRLGGERLQGTMAGMSDMPAFNKTLSENDITAILTYIKSTWSPDIRTIQWQQTQKQP